MAVTQSPYAPPHLILSFLMGTIWPALMTLFLLPATIGMVFVALPFVNRRVRVRWLHVSRAMTYEFAVVCPIAICLVLWRTAWHNDFLNMARSPRSTSFAEFVDLASQVLQIALIVMVVALPPVVSLYWWSYVRMHLRMDRAWAFSMTVIGVLTSIALVYWLNEWTR